MKFPANIYPPNKIYTLPKNRTNACQINHIRQSKLGMVKCLVWSGLAKLELGPTMSFVEPGLTELKFFFFTETKSPNFTF